MDELTQKTESVSEASTGPHPRRWWILLVIAFGVLVIVLDTSVVNIALPAMQRALGATMSELQWIANAYMLTFAAFMLTMGTLGDRIGRSTVFLAGIALFGVGSLAAYFAQGFGGLILLRALMGVGGAMILPTSLAIITDVFPEKERGSAIGIWAGINSLGIALGPIIGGALVQSYSWRSIFFINLPVAVVAIVAGLAIIPNSRADHREKIDLLGTLLSIVWVGALVFGLNQGGSWGWGDWRVLCSIGGAVVGFLLFLLWERHAPSPMMNLRFYRIRGFSAGVASLGIMALALIGITFVLSIFLQFVRGNDALSTGLRLIPLAAGLFVGAGTADPLVKRLGTKGVVVFGFSGTALVALAISFVTLQTPFWLLAVAFGGLGFFLGYIAAPATNAVMGALPKSRSGMASAISTVFRMLAGAIGIAFLGSILTSVYRTSFETGSAAFANLPGELLHAASSSVGAAVIVAEKLPAPAGNALATLARMSFMDAWRVLAFISCGLSALGALVAAISFQRDPAPEDVASDGITA